MNRIFIEVDPDNEYNRWQLESALDGCIDLTLGIKTTKKAKKERETFFTRVICEARFEPNLFEYISQADEVYMCTHIIPIVGGTSYGSPELWYKMMHAAVKAGLKGKRVYNLISFTDIHFENLDARLAGLAFKENKFFVPCERWASWMEIDPATLVKTIINKQTRYGIIKR